MKKVLESLLSFGHIQRNTSPMIGLYGFLRPCIKICKYLEGFVMFLSNKISYTSWKKLSIGEWSLAWIIFQQMSAKHTRVWYVVGGILGDVPLVFYKTLTDTISPRLSFYCKDFLLSQPWSINTETVLSIPGFQTVSPDNIRFMVSARLLQWQLETKM